MHPALAPFAVWLRRADASAPPVRMLDAWVREARLALPDGRPLAVAASSVRVSALDYERRVHDGATIAVREGSWHDAFNVLAWLVFPRLKAAINARHVTEGDAATPNRRGRARDAATLVDESGLVLACDDASLVERLRAHAWRDVFVAHHDVVRARASARVVGHGVLDRLRAPYRALTAKALIVDITPDAADDVVDAAAAAVVARPGFDGDVLTPLPLAALPGWDCERLGDALFDDASVFRPKVLRSPRHRSTRGGALR